jgi:hypothetical protein
MLSYSEKDVEHGRRPHVVFNKNTEVFVMWFEDRKDAITSAGYFVATSKSPTGRRED